MSPNNTLVDFVTNDVARDPLGPTGSGTMIDDFKLGSKRLFRLKAALLVGLRRD